MKKGNDGNLHGRCIKRDLSCINTLFIPKQNDINNLATWYDNTGNVKKANRLLHDIRKQRNWIQKSKKQHRKY